MWTDPNGLTKLGIWPGLGIETFGQFIFSEIPIYDRLHVLSLKHVCHEG